MNDLLTAPRLRSAGATVAGTSTDTVKLLGVDLDQALSMDRHVSSVVSSCKFHIRALRLIRPRLTLDAVLQWVSSVRVSTTATVCSMAPLSATLTTFNVSWTRSPVWLFKRHVVPVPLSQNESNIFNWFQLCWKDKISFDIVAKNGNNVEATFDFVEGIVRLVAFDNVASWWRGLRCSRKRQTSSPVLPFGHAGGGLDGVFRIPRPMYSCSTRSPTQ